METERGQGFPGRSMGFPRKEGRADYSLGSSPLCPGCSCQRDVENGQGEDLGPEQLAQWVGASRKKAEARPGLGGRWVLPHSHLRAWMRTGAEPVTGCLPLAPDQQSFLGRQHWPQAPPAGTGRRVSKQGQVGGSRAASCGGGRLGGAAFPFPQGRTVLSGCLKAVTSEQLALSCNGDKSSSSHSSAIPMGQAWC